MLKCRQTRFRERASRCSTRSRQVCETVAAATTSDVRTNENVNSSYKSSRQQLLNCFQRALVLAPARGNYVLIVARGKKPEAPGFVRVANGSVRKLWAWISSRVELLLITGCATEEFEQRSRRRKKEEKGRGGWEGEVKPKRKLITATGILVVVHKSVEMSLTERIMRANLLVRDS